MTDRTELAIDTVAGRSAPVLFQHFLQQVLENIDDPNTKAQSKRSITLKFTFSPNERRTELGCAVSGDVSLVPPNGETGHAFISRTKDGLVATTNDVTQEELGLVDTATGEVREGLTALS